MQIQPALLFCGIRQEKREKCIDFLCFMYYNLKWYCMKNEVE